MADLADTANEVTEQRLLQALDNRTQFTAPSEPTCRSCGEDIPAERQKIGGVKYCFECQSAIENDFKHYKQ